jgi:hypothetical protein
MPILAQVMILKLAPIIHHDYEAFMAQHATRLLPAHLKAPDANGISFKKRYLLIIINVLPQMSGLVKLQDKKDAHLSPPPFIH